MSSVTPSLRDVYAQKGLAQIPRLLSLQDRNPYSPTYGCFKRTYWLDKTVDFPDALPQFGVLSLTLAYTHDMPDNPYWNEPKMLEWILAGMRFWTSIQHRDGSFDEFYPNEHGWTGPTGFLLYAMLKSYLLLDERGEFPDAFRDDFFTACSKAAEYIIRWDEHGVLANHHAMAVLPLCYADYVLDTPRIGEGYETKLAEFLSYHTEEGWSLEYDGADPGYLSATVSFLGKAWKLNGDDRLLTVMKESTDFLSYFVYPDGFYAGALGSRNTQHFYSHGCELLAPHFTLAGSVADAMLVGLRDGKLVPADIMADRYFLYRIPEHLESYIDFGDRSDTVPLPYERTGERRVFPRGRFFIHKSDDTYLVANAAKGGVVKVFDTAARLLRLSDCGFLGRTETGKVLTSQWIDSEYAFDTEETGFTVSGSLHTVPANKLFTPFKHIVFRALLLVCGWHTGVAYRIKGLIRRLLMLKSGHSSFAFSRSVSMGEKRISIVDTLRRTGAERLASLDVGGEFFVRYVPQSRYFQLPELHTTAFSLPDHALDRLHSGAEITITTQLDMRTGEVTRSLR